MIPGNEVLFVLKRVALVTGSAALFIVVVLVAFAYLAFPLMRYASRVRDPVEAKRNGDALAQTRDETVVAVIAHPDDAEWYAGGVLALLARRGNRVVVIDGTSGEKGGNGVPDLAKVREAEQREAGSIAGYSRIVFARNPDRGLTDDKHFRNQVRDVFEQEQPSVLITFDAEKQAIGYRHSDHRAAGAASLAVARTFPTVRTAYLFSSAEPNVLVEIAPVVGIKGRSRAAHKSQWTGRSGPAGWLVRALSFLVPNRANQGMRAGSASSYPEADVEYGEPYRLVKIP